MQDNRFSANIKPVADKVSSVTKSFFSSGASEENLRERRYFWTARAFIAICVVSIFINIVMLAALSTLTPLTRVQPFYLTFEDKDSQIVRIIPMKPTPQVLDQITESLIREYTILRNAVVSDDRVMIQRWGDQGPVRWMSSDDVYSAFNRSTNEALTLLREQRLVRDVNILTVYKLQKGEADGDVWDVRMETTDMLPENAEARKRTWNIRLQVKYMPYQQKWSERLKNPMGFKIVRYGQSAEDLVGEKNKE